MGTKSKWLRIAALTGTMALLVAACGDGDDGGGGDGTGAQTITVLHDIGGEEEQEALQAALDAFEAATGHTVQPELTDDIATTLNIRVDGNNPPDVVLHPQPGALAAFAAEGALTPLADVGVTDFDGLVPGMVETGTFDGTVYGVVVKAAVSSLLWYRTDLVDSPPTTWDELITLSDELVAGGTTPWCIGIESGGATGWVTTNWIEDIVLGNEGGDGYDQWTAGDLDFASPEITAAFEQAAEIFFNEDYVVGGTTGIVNTPFGDAAVPMWQDPAACALHRQAGFIEGSFTGEFGTDYNVTLFPATDGGAVFSGNVAAVMTDSQAAGQLVEFLLSSEGQEAWHSHPGSGSLSVRADFDTSQYPSASLTGQGELLAGASVARFDGSDLMPSAVGGNAFFSELVAWLNGQDLATTLANIDAAWPA
ncbi:MAG: ABC transporter substrate-binding protein [Nitriliruptorales bacterium]|nr:ABC transporter substrate-binding protein [Nitriliruptorales bacterium]